MVGDRSIKGPVGPLVLSDLIAQRLARRVRTLTLERNFLVTLLAIAVIWLLLERM